MKRHRHPDERSLFELLKPAEQSLPPGFVEGPLPGTVCPTSGTHADVPMMRDSALARTLTKKE